MPWAVRLVIALLLALVGLVSCSWGTGIIGGGSALLAIWGAVILIFAAVIFLTGLGRRPSQRGLTPDPAEPDARPPQPFAHPGVF